jgi:hypothetical protein
VVSSNLVDYCPEWRFTLMLAHEELKENRIQARAELELIVRN